MNTNKTIPSSPGRSVQFHAGRAVIRDERDLIACLRTPNVQLEVAPEYAEWIARWMNDCGTVQPPVANVVLPPGFHVEGEPGLYTVYKLDPKPSEPIDLPDVDEDDHAPLPADVAGKWRPGGPGRPPKNR